MISKYLPIEHKDLEYIFHNIIKENRKIQTTIVPTSWKPPANVLNQIKDKIWINDIKYENN